MQVTQIKELRKLLKKNGIKLLDYAESAIKDGSVWRIIISGNGEIATLSLGYDGSVIRCNGCAFISTLKKISVCIQELK